MLSARFRVCALVGCFADESVPVIVKSGHFSFRLARTRCGGYADAWSAAFELVLTSVVFCCFQARVGPVGLHTGHTRHVVDIILDPPRVSSLKYLWPGKHGRDVCKVSRGQVPSAAEQLSKFHRDFWRILELASLNLDF